MECIRSWQSCECDIPKTSLTGYGKDVLEQKVVNKAPKKLNPFKKLESGLRNSRKMTKHTKTKMKKQLRGIWGDNCYWCSTKMCFDKRWCRHPNYATIEHDLCKSKGWVFNNLRLCCLGCNK